MNIDDIRRELDRLHAEAARCQVDPFATSGECVISSDELRRSIYTNWPTISAALADLDKALTDNCNERDALMEEVQLLRRKAAAFDAINSGDVMVREWWVLGSDRFMLYVNRDLLTAIEAALAAKENKQ